MSRTFKRLVVIVVSCLFLMSLCACSGNTPQTPNTPKVVQNALADGTYKTNILLFGFEKEQLESGMSESPVIVTGDKVVYVSNPVMIPDSPDMDCYVDLTSDKLTRSSGNVYFYDGISYHYPANWGDSEFAIAEDMYEVVEPLTAEQNYSIFQWGDSVELWIKTNGEDKAIYICRPEMVPDSPDDKCYVTLDNAKVEGFDYAVPYYRGVVYHYPAAPQTRWSAELASCEIEGGTAKITYVVVPGAEKTLVKEENQCQFVDDGLGIVEEVAEYDKGLYRTVYVIHSIA